MNWSEKLRMASSNGGVTLNEQQCAAIAYHIEQLTRALKQAKELMTERLPK